MRVKLWGFHGGWRPGQEWGLGVVCEQRRGLLVAPTGTGKSLCYQLPALALPGVTIVVSPLIALMTEQLNSLPPLLQVRSASMSGSLGGGAGQVAQTLVDLQAGRLKLLFVSPERLTSNAFRRMFCSLSPRPQVSLLCVDEAHCVSSWSHNFRPAYLRLGGVVDSWLQPQALLALTATAPEAVARDICTQLRINTAGPQTSLPAPYPVAATAAATAFTDSASTEKQPSPSSSCLDLPYMHRAGGWSRDNLHLTVVEYGRDDGGGGGSGGYGGGGGCLSAPRVKAIVDVLSGRDAWSEVERTKALAEANRPLKPGEKRKRVNPGNSTALPPSLQAAALEAALSPSASIALKGSALVYVTAQWETEVLAEALSAELGERVVFYHAGMEPADRLKAQEQWRKGRVRVCVATVAFGMGIDRANVRLVCHAALPRSIEQYVQEIGRAGRDGKPARCLALVDGSDAKRHHSLAHRDCLSQAQLFELLKLIFRSQGGERGKHPAKSELGKREEGGGSNINSNSSGSSGGSDGGASGGAVSTHEATVIPTSSTNLQNSAAAAAAAPVDAPATIVPAIPAIPAFAAAATAPAAPAFSAAVSAAEAAAASVVVVVAEVESSLDLRREALETVLTLLEQPPFSLLHIEADTYETCTLTSAQSSFAELLETNASVSGCGAAVLRALMEASSSPLSASSSSSSSFSQDGGGGSGGGKGTASRYGFGGGGGGGGKGSNNSYGGKGGKGNSYGGKGGGGYKNSYGGGGGKGGGKGGGYQHQEASFSRFDDVTYKQEEELVCSVSQAAAIMRRSFTQGFEGFGHREIFRELHRLQSNGVLSYKLSNPAIVAKLHSSHHSYHQQQQQQQQQSAAPCPLPWRGRRRHGQNGKEGGGKDEGGGEAEDAEGGGDGLQDLATLLHLLLGAAELNTVSKVTSLYRVLRVGAAEARQEVEALLQQKLQQQQQQQQTQKRSRADDEDEKQKVLLDSVGGFVDAAEVGSCKEGPEGLGGREEEGHTGHRSGGSGGGGTLGSRHPPRKCMHSLIDDYFLGEGGGGGGGDDGRSFSSSSSSSSSSSPSSFSSSVSAASPLSSSSPSPSPTSVVASHRCVSEAVSAAVQAAKEQEQGAALRAGSTNNTFAAALAFAESAFERLSAQARAADWSDLPWNPLTPALEQKIRSDATLLYRDAKFTHSVGSRDGGGGEDDGSGAGGKGSKGGLTLCGLRRSALLSRDSEGFAALSAAKIFHGVASPCLRRQVWQDTPWWGRHKELPFSCVAKLAGEAFLAMKAPDSRQHL